MHGVDLLSFGCHNLTGGSSLRRSIRLIHCAIDHGITRFDVAPSYGLGTAETVLGKAIGNRDPRMEITTKFGIEPPKFGRVFAWGREPYRRLKRVLGKGPSLPLGSLAACEASHVRLMKSLERSLKALKVDRVDTLLTHEHIDKALLRENLEDLESGRHRGLFNSFGCSGERVSVERALSMFSDFARIVQISVSDWETYAARPIVRLFGAIRILKPQIARLASRDKRYADDLLATLVGVESLEERLALGALIAARTMFPRSTLLINTRSEIRIGLIARFLGDRALLDWGMTHRGVHNRMLAGCARI
jgi:Aldo/keto reductase family